METCPPLPLLALVGVLRTALMLVPAEVSWTALTIVRLLVLVGVSRTALTIVRLLVLVGVLRTALTIVSLVVRVGVLPGMPVVLRPPMSTGSLMPCARTPHPHPPPPGPRRRLWETGP